MDFRVVSFLIYSYDETSSGCTERGTEGEKVKTLVIFRSKRDPNDQFSSEKHEREMKSYVCSKKLVASK